MENKVSSGTAVIDKLLEGGYEKGTITTIYGPASTGKTNLCLLCIANSVKDKKIIYIDTEGSFSVSRFKQICKNYEEVLERIIFLNPTTYEEQREIFELLKEIVDDKVGLIVFDGVAMLYRLELGKNQDVANINRELGQQLSFLVEVARKKQIPVLITNQVYADFEDKSAIKMVGGDLLKYQSKCLIELQKLKNGRRKAIIRKHRSLPEDKEVIFIITTEGIEEVKNS